MDVSMKKKKMTTTSSDFMASIDANKSVELQSCSNPSCFFCIMKGPDPSLRRPGLTKFFKEMSFQDDHEHVLVLSGVWNIAMAHPDDPEFPSLGIFDCMASLLRRGVSDTDWLYRDQNIYIPYYAAHVVGSYTMNKVEFAEKAVHSGVILPLMEVLKGNLSWVEQRVSVRALGHLASYERTFEAVAAYEEEVVSLAMELASTCLSSVYANFVAKDKKRRLKYQSDLLTRGVGGLEMENRKAEEWASQLQCWSLYLLNCFACKERSLDLICKPEFLKELCRMWGGFVNHTSPSGVGLIRILCYSKYGRQKIAESNEVIESLCNLSRSSDDWQYMGIDCLLLLLKDPDTRYKVIEISTMFLIDLVELKSLADHRSNLGEDIARALLLDYKQGKVQKRKVQKALQEIWEIKVERRKKEKTTSEEKVAEKMVLMGLIKQQANHMFWLGDVEEAVLRYTEALAVCPLKLRNERVVLYSNRAQCHLLLRDPDSAIRDSTRALCLSTPANSHGKSLWRRSQAYDMKGLAKESLMDCIMFVNGCIKSGKAKRVKIPYHAARMISKQMEATWLFAEARSKTLACQAMKGKESDGGDDDDDDDFESRSDKLQHDDESIMRMIIEKESLLPGLSTIIEEPPVAKGRSKSEVESSRRRKKFIGARSM